MRSSLKTFIPRPAINYLKHLPLALLAGLYNGFPAKKLKVIGVTGTDGKTTTVNLIHHLLSSAGYKAAMVSTVSAKIGQEEIDTGFHVTAPSPWLLQKLLRKMIRKQMEYVVLETTSHGLDQFRLFGVSFSLGVITNITHEHLDYHKTFEKYLKAKAIMLKNSRTCILNKDDKSFSFLSDYCQRKNKKVITYGLEKPADFTPKTFPFSTNLPGKYNQYNCLAAIAVCKTIGVSDQQIKNNLLNFKGVVGRMEEIKTNRDFRVIVDFAHTPNALKNVLSALREQLIKIKDKGRLIVVFGSAGLRDQQKRPMMGEIACTYADLSILTAEDPRTESVEEICQQIAQGCLKASGKFKIITDRKQAIEGALKEAKKNDLVVICGKGHEKSMCYGNKEYPWSDQEVVRNYFDQYSKKK